MCYAPKTSIHVPPCRMRPHSQHHGRTRARESAPRFWGGGHRLPRRSGVRDGLSWPQATTGDTLGRQRDSSEGRADTRTAQQDHIDARPLHATLLENEVDALDKLWQFTVPDRPQAPGTGTDRTQDVLSSCLSSEGREPEIVREELRGMSDYVGGEVGEPETAGNVLKHERPASGVEAGLGDDWRGRRDSNPQHPDRQSGWS